MECLTPPDVSHHTHTHRRGGYAGGVYDSSVGRARVVVRRRASRRLVRQRGSVTFAGVGASRRLSGAGCDRPWDDDDDDGDAGDADADARGWRRWRWRASRRR